MNRPIRVLSLFCLILFLALMANVTYVQYFRSGSLDTHAGNQRREQADFSRKRGAILAGKFTIADSVKSNDPYLYQRRYPKGYEYSPITGFFSFKYGEDRGIEASQNDLLAGNDDRLFVNQLVDLVNNAQPEGGNVETTINPRVQDAAWKGLTALGPGVQGAAVAIEPSTGKILAMVSTPSYDPSGLASHDVKTSDAAWKSLNANSSDSPLFNRAIQTPLPPGSTFKLVTSAAALEAGVKPTDEFNGLPTYKIPGHSSAIVNENNESCGNMGRTKVTFQQALDYSCNAAFADLTLHHLSGAQLRDQAVKFGFDQATLDDIPLVAQSQFPDRNLSDPAFLALRAIGQYDVAATPLQMAMVSAGIANGGVVMKPYLVNRLTSSKLDVLEQTSPREIDRAISPQTASTLTNMMIDVVNHGTGTNAQIPGIAVAGKTGTAQSSPSRPPYAWFTSFAPAQNPKIAVAVLVQKSGTARTDIAGGALAAPIAKAMMEAEISQ